MPSWELLGSLSGRLGNLSGAPWAVQGASWTLCAPLGRLLGCLGGLLGCLKSLLEAFWGLLGHIGSSLGTRGGRWRNALVLWGPSWKPSLVKHSIVYHFVVHWRLRCSRRKVTLSSRLESLRLGTFRRYPGLSNEPAWTFLDTSWAPL